MLSSVPDKVTLLVETFPYNSNIYDSRSSLPSSPSEANTKPHDISVTPRILNKVVTGLDISKIPVLLLKNYRTEFSFILADLLTCVVATQTGFLHKLCEFYDWTFSLISSFLNNIQLYVVLDRRSTQESCISEGARQLCIYTGVLLPSS